MITSGPHPCAKFHHDLVTHLGTTYDVHLELIGKHVMDFLLVLIELLSIVLTAEALRAKVDRKSATSLERGHFEPKFQVEGCAPTNHFCTHS